MCWPVHTWGRGSSFSTALCPGRCFLPGTAASPPWCWRPLPRQVSQPGWCPWDPPSGSVNTVGWTLRKPVQQSNYRLILLLKEGLVVLLHHYQVVIYIIVRMIESCCRSVTCPYLTVRLLGDKLGESQLFHGSVSQNRRIWRLAAAFNHRRLEDRQEPAVSEERHIS